MKEIPWIIECLIDVLRGEDSNYDFFVYLNSGWLQMQFRGLYGNNPSEKDCWEWMMKNPKTIILSQKDYDSLISKMDT